MPIICGEFLLPLKSQVEIFQNIFSEIVLSFEFIQKKELKSFKIY